MTTFIGLYRGEKVSKAKLVAVSADPKLVSEFAARLLSEDPQKAVNNDAVKEGTADIQTEPSI